MNAETRILWLPTSDYDYESRAAVFDYETNSFVGSHKNHAGVRIDSTTALQSTVVLACVRVLAESIASLPLHVYRRREDGGKELAREHPLYRLLHTSPNSWQTSFEWREQQMLHLGTYGQSFSEIVRDSRDIVSELITLHPSRMHVERIETGRLRYTYQEETGGVTTYTQDQIMHIRWLSDDGVNGIVPVDLAKDAIGLARACEIHGASFFGNGARPGVVLATDSVLSAEAAENLRNNWERVHRGPDRASRTAVLQGGLKPMEIGSSNQESQFLETRRFQIEEICRLYRVPPHLVGDLTRSSFSNIEQQSIDFVQHTLVPWLRRFETAFARDLLFDSETYFIEYDTRGLLRGDAAARGSYYSTLYNLGVASINEIRGWENLDPVDGGDLRFVGLSMQTLGEANAKVKAASESPPPAQPTADITGLTQVLQQVAAGSVTPDAAQTMMKAVFPSLPDDDAGKLLSGVKKQPDPAEVASQAPAESEEPQPTADVNGLLAVLAQVGAGAVTPDAALSIIRAVFPAMPDSLATAIVAGVQNQAAAAPAPPGAAQAPAEAKTVGAARVPTEVTPTAAPSNEQQTTPRTFDDAYEQAARSHADYLSEILPAQIGAESRVFCSTGKGGGKDASCSPKDAGSGGGTTFDTGRYGSAQQTLDRVNQMIKSDVDSEKEIGLSESVRPFGRNGVSLIEAAGGSSEEDPKNAYLLENHDFGLSDSQYKLRDQYVANDKATVKMNAELRSGKLPARAKKIDGMFDGAESVEDAVLFRGAVLPPGLHEALVPGASFVDRGFMSCGRHPSTAKLYAESRKDDGADGDVVIFRLGAPAGTRIVPMDYEEFVVERGRTVRVVGRRKADGKIYIDAEIE